ncbi:MAG: hypothetical protein MHM6MM_005864 [Cercozoa sp. M6MM]
MCDSALNALEVRDSAVAGRGCFATRDISMGELVHRERAAVAVPLLSHFGSVKNAHLCDVDLRFREGDESRCDLCRERRSGSRELRSVLEEATKQGAPSEIQLALALLLESSKRSSPNFGKSETVQVDSDEAPFACLRRSLQRSCSSKKTLRQKHRKRLRRFLRSSEFSQRALRALVTAEAATSEEAESVILNDCLNMIYANAFGLRVSMLDDNEYALALFERASMFNHSCAPNCHIRFLGDELFVYASQEIKQGQELCFSFVRNFECARHEDRQKVLRAQLGFPCACERCANTKLTEQEKFQLMDDLALSVATVEKTAEIAIRNGRTQEGANLYLEFLREHADEFDANDVAALPLLERICTVSALGATEMELPLMAAKMGVEFATELPDYGLIDQCNFLELRFAVWRAAFALQHRPDAVVDIDTDDADAATVDDLFDGAGDVMEESLDINDLNGGQDDRDSSGDVLQYAREARGMISLMFSDHDDMSRGFLEEAAFVSRPLRALVQLLAQLD